MVRSDTDIVVAARSGDPAAFGELFDRWFDRCFDVARNIVRNDDTAADVAQDVFLTAWQRLDQLDNPDKFGGWLLRISRNKALNRLQKEQRSRPEDGVVMADLHDRSEHDDLVGSNRLTDTPAISEARDRQELVWAAAAALGERESSILDLHLRHQLSAAEIAEELDITANNAHQLLYRLRAKLGDAVANHQIWRTGRPVCPDLRAMGIAAFDASGNKQIQRHRSGCDVCADQHRSVVDPQKMFAAAPIAVAPLLLRQRAASALEAAGIPTGGDQLTPPGETAIGPGDSSGPGSKSASRGARRGRRALLATMTAAVVAVVATALLVDPAGDPDLAGPDPTASPTTTDAVPTTPTSRSISTTNPAGVSTTATTVSTTATTPPPAPPADPPEIVRYSLSEALGSDLVCENSSDLKRQAVWLVDNADTIELTIDGTVVDVTASENWVFCGPLDSTVTLTATGPGGTAESEQII